MRHFLRGNGLFIAIVAVMVVAYLYLRTPGDKMASTATFDAQVATGTPTLVEFYSNT